MMVTIFRDPVIIIGPAEIHDMIFLSEIRWFYPKTGLANLCRLRAWTSKGYKEVQIHRWLSLPMPAA
jgi:hypothetical protein